MALVTFANGNVLEAQELNDSFAAVDWNENVIINGAMQVAQRGTSTASITTTGYYTVDRFAIGISSLGTWTQSQEADAPTGSGFRNSLKMLCSTADTSPAAGDYLFVQQSLEGQNVQQFLKGTALAKPFALSFWVKSNVTGTYIAELRDADNTRTVSASYTISASGTWEKKTITFPADTTGSFDNDNASSLQLSFWLGAGTTYTSGTLATTWASQTNANRAVGQTNLASAINNYWQITGVQLQPSRESQYLFQDYGTVLAQCQRYYYLQASGTGKTLGSGTYYTATSFYCTTNFPVTMRATPTLSATSGTGYYTVYSNNTSDTINSLTIDTPHTNGASLYNNTEASGVAGDGAFIATSNASASIAFSAEL